MKIKKSLLLTGAGFTANFGGFLGSDVWFKIFNNPNLNQKIKKLFTESDGYDFETLYSTVINSSDYSSAEKDEFKQIVKGIYGDLHDVVTGFDLGPSNPEGVELRGVLKLFSSFCGTAGETGIIFTLNQDLFMERFSKSKALGLGTLRYMPYMQKIESSQLDPDFRVELPDEQFLDDFRAKHLSSVGDRIYVKLHGSSGWVSQDGSDRLILGIAKKEEIANEPLLKWYFKLFEDALYRSDVRLLAIGYGFRDSHINEVLIKAISEYGLKLFIISPEDFKAFQKRIPPEIKIEGYEMKALKQIYPPNHMTTDTSKDLLRIFPSP